MAADEEELAPFDQYLKSCEEQTTHVMEEAIHPVAPDILVLLVEQWTRNYYQQQKNWPRDRRGTLDQYLKLCEEQTTHVLVEAIHLHAPDLLVVLREQWTLDYLEWQERLAAQVKAAVARLAGGCASPP